VSETDKIYLVGFMGAGKTTLGRALASRLGWRLVDVDAQIEQRERRTVAAIFREAGEAYFRAVERAVVQDLLSVRHAVVATGGGTFVDPDTRARMLADGTVVWLDLPFEQVLARLPGDGRRPLAADRTDLERLYVARGPAYAQAHLRVDSGAVRVEQLVEQVLDGLGW
jgi:shikimate kinase